MDTSFWLLLLLQFVLIFLNALFSCAETAVPLIGEARLERLAEQGDKRARRLCRLIREPGRFLDTVQATLTLSGFFASAFAAVHFSAPMATWLLSLGLPLARAAAETLATVLITLLLSFFTLVIGVLVPRRLAMHKPEKTALAISGPVSAVSALFRPLVWLCSHTANLILRLMGIDPNHVEEQVSEEEIRMMVDAGSEKGAIDEQEKEFIENVFEFDDLTAGEIATHRTDVTILWQDDSMEDWAQTIHSSRHTRYPVCGESADHVIGTLNAKDYFRLEDKTRESVMALIRPPYFVPRSIKADVLFRNMKKERHGMAVVLDEYGGMDGIVTINDLIEQLVGDLGEETAEAEAREPHIEQQSENTWVLIGNVALTDIEQALDVDIGQEEVDTFTGLVFKEMGMVPPDGEHQINMELKGLKVHITAIEDHQIIHATVTKPLTEETEKE
mgnify:CR=1 FL=1